jgi:hypothetical protein
LWLKVTLFILHSFLLFPESLEIHRSTFTPGCLSVKFLGSNLHRSPILEIEH